jgi:hypothetical protein
MAHLDDHESLDADDLPENHSTPGPCFSCWCYSCGGRTDRPRIERTNDRHPGDASHRWCFE